MPNAPTAALERRHRVVREALNATGVEALVVLGLPNILYLTNFTGSSAIVVLTRDRLLFLTDFRYITAVSEMRGTPGECPALELIPVDGSYDGTLATVLRQVGGRIGFEAAHLTVSRHRWLVNALADSVPPVELVALEGIVERARARKDDYE